LGGRKKEGKGKGGGGGKGVGIVDFVRSSLFLSQPGNTSSACAGKRGKGGRKNEEGQGPSAALFLYHPKRIVKGKRREKKGTRAVAVKAVAPISFFV